MIQVIINAHHAMEQAEKEMWAEVQRNDNMEYRNSDICRVIDEYIHSERDRKILKRRYCDGICYEPLAEEFDLSVRQVKNIVYKNESILFTLLEKRGTL